MRIHDAYKRHEGGHKTITRLLFEADCLLSSARLCDCLLEMLVVESRRVWTVFSGEPAVQH